ncbi:hypothetical protein FLJC2902T_08840 [Flavobacterium limnosediminis JC2902]|uniref:Uncharacterized protein n=1 Tax=Flavobacterium limnosediminis JC2902 TaxID=1341181 RepID=V6SSN8_9FLAO|nr:hypothetical protein FLJC2902T_08840 [Flavobacterium limnosediminis JC2902]
MHNHTIYTVFSVVYYERKTYIWFNTYKGFRLQFVKKELKSYLKLCLENYYCI